jgi:hypothetical protein
VKRSWPVATMVAAALLLFPLLPAAAQGQRPLEIRLERSEERGLGPLWIGIRVTVTEAGRPFGDPHQVFAVATNERGDETEPFRLKVLDLDDPTQPPGTHSGFLILPYGGRWTLTATVNRLQEDPDAPPVVLARGGSLDVEAEGPAAPGGTGSTVDEASRPAAANAFDVGVLWIHSLLAILWGLAVGLLALLALPQGRLLLSDYAGNLFDSRLATIARGMWWLTAGVIATGIYNLVNSVPYRVPLTPTQVERVFQLPWARAYYVDLIVKLTIYAVMVMATVPLIREARRQAGRWLETAAEAAPSVPRSFERSPWEPAEAMVPTGASLPLASAGHPRADEPVAGWQDEEVTATSLAPLVTLLVVLGAVLVLAVTLLLYFHRLSEVARAG